MLTFSRARADDVRALAGAIALGSGAGLLVGGAFLAASTPLKAPAIAPAASALAGKLQASNAAAPGAKSFEAPAGIVATLRDRFRLAVLNHPAARPFQFPSVAGASTDLHCLTEAVYFEARGEEKAGQQAVAQVVLNRVRHPAFPKTICGVVHQRTAGGCQFSFACSVHDARSMDNSAWRRAQSVASSALHGAVMAAVGDATHFQTARSSPFEGLLKVAQIGAHIFYRFGGHAGAADMFNRTPAPSSGAPKAELAKAEPPAKAALDAPKASADSPPSQTTNVETAKLDAAPKKSGGATVAEAVTKVPVKATTADTPRPTLVSVRIPVIEAKPAPSPPTASTLAKPPAPDVAKPVTVAMALAHS